MLRQQDLNILLKLYNDGSYDQAEDMASDLAQRIPEDPFPWKILVALFGQTERFSQGLIAAQNVIKLAPQDPEAHYNLGNILSLLSQPDDALCSFRQALRLNPNYPQAHFNSGKSLEALGRSNEALDCYRRAILIKPDYFDAHYNLAVNFYNQNRLKDAESSYKNLIQIKPDYAEAHNNLGVILRSNGRLCEAELSFRKAIEVKVDYADAYYNLAQCLMTRNRLKEAKSCYESAIKYRPMLVEAYVDLAFVLKRISTLTETEKIYRQAIALRPDLPEAHRNLGVTLQQLFRLNEAAGCHERAIELRPSYALAHQNLGEVLMLQRKWVESLACYEHARSLNPNLDYLLGDSIHVRQKLCDWDALPENIEELVTRTNNNERVSLPFILQALVDCPETIQKGTEIFSKHNHPRSDVLPKIGIYQDHEKIRIGYFSPDFCKHPVTTGIADLFKLHDRENFEVHAFSFGPDIKDQWNTKVREGVDFYHDVLTLSDQEIALLARSLEIDIAVDLTGYTKNGRTGIFAIGAAPVQIVFMGFLGTMGASYYDYIIADKVSISEQSKDYCTENIVYLPSCQVNSEQIDFPDFSYDRKYFGIPEDSFVFCCFNQNVKITPDVFDSWTRILEEVKNSLLMLHVDNDTAVKNLRQQMSIRGLNPDRLIFGNHLSGSEYWSRYNAVDLFLDTFIYSAGMTASDALRMGCPLITWMGNSYASRLGASLLSAVGLPELITTTKAEYESLAVQLATHPEELKVLKDKLLVNLSTQPLFDTQQFSHSIEEAYIAMYERSQSKREPIDIYVDKNATGFE